MCLWSPGVSHLDSSAAGRALDGIIYASALLQLSRNAATGAAYVNGCCRRSQAKASLCMRLTGLWHWPAGLQPNETYMLAVAIYDEQHHQIGDLGEPTAAVAALLPLPLYQCWCYLAQLACRLGEGVIMQQAAHVVVPHFVMTSPDRPLWQESPLDSQTLHRCELLLAAPWPRGS